MPWSEETARHPVASISWHDVKRYIAWLNQSVVGQKDGPYRLLSEAEWEYLSRGVRSAEDPHTLYHWGDALEDACAYANVLNSSMPDVFDIRRKGLNCGNNPTFVSEVGSFRPNNFNVFDTAGNVAEWVEDCWHESYDHRPTDSKPWINLSGISCDRVVRGGSWYGELDNLRSAVRVKLAPELFGFNIGFRVARDLNWRR